MSDQFRHVAKALGILNSGVGTSRGKDCRWRQQLLAGSGLAREMAAGFVRRQGESALSFFGMDFRWKVRRQRWRSRERGCTRLGNGRRKLPNTWRILRQILSKPEPRDDSEATRRLLLCPSGVWSFSKTVIYYKQLVSYMGGPTHLVSPLAR